MIFFVISEMVLFSIDERVAHRNECPVEVPLPPPINKLFRKRRPQKNLKKSAPFFADDGHGALTASSMEDEDNKKKMRVKEKNRDRERERERENKRSTRRG